MAEALTDLEQGCEPPKEIEKFLNGKFIKVGGDRVGYTYKGDWKWTTFGTQRYSQESRDWAKAYAEAE